MINRGYDKEATQAWKWPVLSLLVLGALVAGGFVLYEQIKRWSVDNFEDCVAAGNPVLESFPEQCFANGRTFVNNNIDLDQIKGFSQ